MKTILLAFGHGVGGHAGGGLGLIAIGFILLIAFFCLAGSSDKKS